MTRKVPSVPPLGAGDSSLRATVDSLRSVITYVTAQEQSPILPLAPNDTNAQVIAKINEIIARLQVGR